MTRRTTATDDDTAQQDQSDAENTSHNDSAETLKQAEPDPADEAQPTEAELDAVDEAEAARDKEHETAIVASERKLLRFAAGFPSTTPNEHTIAGYGGIVLQLGDVRRVAIALKNKYRGE